MRRLIYVTFLLLSISTVSAQQYELPEFGEDWQVAPSPDPDRLRVECQETLRFHGLVEVPYPASCAAFTKTSYVIDENSSLRLGVKRGKVTADSLHFRYGFAGWLEAKYGTIAAQPSVGRHACLLRDGSRLPCEQYRCVPCVAKP